jgi:hypothetical protein
MLKVVRWACETIVILDPLYVPGDVIDLDGGYLQ